MKRERESTINGSQCIFAFKRERKQSSIHFHQHASTLCGYLFNAFRCFSVKTIRWLINDTTCSHMSQIQSYKHKCAPKSLCIFTIDTMFCSAEINKQTYVRTYVRTYVGWLAGSFRFVSFIRTHLAIHTMIFVLFNYFLFLILLHARALYSNQWSCCLNSWKSKQCSALSVPYCVCVQVDLDRQWHFSMFYPIHFDWERDKQTIIVETDTATKWEKEWDRNNKNKL